MGWLKDKILGVSIATQRRELAEFLAVAELLDEEVLAVVVVAATALRHEMEEKFGWDLLRPDTVNLGSPMAASIIASGIKDKQRHGHKLSASGLMVWLHTLRGADDLALSVLTRAMWGMLARGFPLVPEVAAGFCEGGAPPTNLAGYDCIPSGKFLDPL